MADSDSDAERERREWSDDAEARMSVIDDASTLVQTTYLCSRLIDDLLSLYRANRITMDAESSAQFKRTLSEVRQRAENVELHIKMQLARLLRERTPEPRHQQERREDRRTLVRRRWDRRRNPDDTGAAA